MHEASSLKFQRNFSELNSCILFFCFYALCFAFRKAKTDPREFVYKKKRKKIRDNLYKKEKRKQE